VYNYNYWGGQYSFVCSKLSIPSILDQFKQELTEFLYKGNVMKRSKNATILKVLILIIGLFLVVTVTGCIDPVATESQEEHFRLGEIAKRQLQYGLPSQLNPQQGQMYYPAP
jgi:hypothetical protein